MKTHEPGRRASHQVNHWASQGLRRKVATVASLLAWSLVGAVVSAPVVSAQPGQPSPDAAAWLRSGPMPGHAEIQETVLWLQTWDPRRVSIRFWPEGDAASSRLSEPVTTSAAGDFIAKVPLTGLRFGTEYRYELYLDGWPVPLPEDARFHTQAMWRWRQPAPDFTFALGSCAYLNDPPFDRPGRPYGSGSAIFDTIAEQRPAFMLWLGDNVYTREADWLSPDGLRYRNAFNRQTPSLQRLLNSTHHYAIWDDHDYGPDNSDRTFRWRQESLDIFRDYWANPPMGTLETPGAFSRFEWGDVDFFLLDNRFYRSPNLWDGPGKEMLGAAQLRWLQEALVSSKATFKIVAVGSQVVNDMLYDTSWQEMWQLFAEEKQSFLDFLVEQRVEGVLFLTGDRHHSELLKLERPGSYPLYDYTSSPLTAGTANAKEEADNPLRVPGTFVQHRHNFGMITVSGPADDRRLLLRAMASDGTEFWHHEISRSELTLPSGDTTP